MSIPELFMNLGIDVQGRYTGEHKVLCPQCSHTRKKNSQPILSINLDTGLYKCWNDTCGWSGCVKIQQNDHKPVYSRPKEKKQGEYRPKELKELTAPVIEFFKTRGISHHTLLKYGVRESRAWFHEYKAEADCIAFQYIKNNMRVATKYRDAGKNMTQDKGGEKCFYNFDALAKVPKKLYITEGEIDALTLLECGFTDVVSVPDGAPSPDSKNFESKFNFLTDEAMKLIDQVNEVVLVVDSDLAGRLLEAELSRRIGLDKCLRIQYPEGCKDINDVLVKEGPEAVEDTCINAQHFPVSGLNTFNDYHQEITDMFNGVQQEHFSTGHPHMDKHLKIKTGQLNIVTGTPGSGKSEWVDDVMINTIQNHDLKWGVFSPENYPATVYFRKLAEKYENTNFSNFTQERLNNSVAELSEYVNLIVDNDEDEVTMDYLFKRIRALVFRKGIRAVIIDPWNEISHNIGTREDIYLAKVLRKIKRFIRKYNLSFWLVCHPKNPQKDKDGNYYKSTAYDIAGGYTWNAKGDNIFSVWRDRQNKKKPVEVDILKIKYKTDGELGTCYYWYQYATGKFQSCKSSLDDPTEVEDKGGRTVNDW